MKSARSALPHALLSTPVRSAAGVCLQVKSGRSFRWIIGACRESGGRPMSARLADEIMAAYKKEGKAITTRENTHRMAEANKAFAHFAW